MIRAKIKELCYTKLYMTFNSKIPHDLKLLPPSIDSIMDAEFLDLVKETRAELGELKGYLHSMLNPLLLLSPAIMKESLDSSEIENINTTMINVLENQLIPEMEQRKADKEVLKYKEAILHGYKNLENLSLSSGLILAVQKKLFSPPNTDYRKSQNIIQNITTKEIVYTPPKANKIPEYMKNLENFMNEATLPKLDPIIKCAISHYQFEAIHPFNDGNGRTGRILMVLQLVNEEILDLPILYISGYINKNRNDYYRLLREVSSEENWKEYMTFMIKGFYLQAKETKGLIISIMREFRILKKEIKLKYKKIYSADLVEALFTYPVITPSWLAKELDIHHATASRYLRTLVAGDLLSDKNVGKYHFFINKGLMNVIYKK